MGKRAWGEVLEDQEGGVGAFHWWRDGCHYC